MSRKSLLILTSSVFVFGALLIGAYTSGVMRFGKANDAAEGSMGMTGDFGSSSGVGIESIYGSLNRVLGKSTAGYRAEMRNDHIVLLDGASGTELGTIRTVGADQMTLSGIVGNVGPVAGEAKSRVQQQIDEFNESSSVGTLRLQEATGDLTLEHKIDPRRSSADEIAKVAVTFSDKARQQSAKFAASNPAVNS